MSVVLILVGLPLAACAIFTLAHLVADARCLRERRW